jgi:mono/diheme cytochrome c family protein
MWRAVKWLLVAGAVLFVVIQFVPYGRDHDNPPVLAEPAWDSPATRELAVRACFDCHSNETNWAWYSNVAPASWLIQHDVDEGRAKLNWSEWGQESEGEESAETVREGSMPPTAYTILHSEARLSDQEMAALAAGLEATFGSEGHEDESDEDD